ncbi:MAG: hypothetical protein AABX61_01330 [Nanoarchaeota archaeon]
MENPYKKIKDFGKKAILITGLAGILNGCTENVEYKTTQIFKDLNNDGKPEHVYLIYNSKESGFGFPENIYDLIVRSGEEKDFGEPKLLQRFRYVKPKEIKIEDINGDENQDLVYLIYNPKESGFGFPENIYDLLVRYGNGDGTFQQPKLLQRYKGIVPEGIN